MKEQQKTELIEEIKKKYITKSVTGREHFIMDDPWLVKHVIEDFSQALDQIALTAREEIASEVKERLMQRAKVRSNKVYKDFIYWDGRVDGINEIYQDFLCTKKKQK